MRQSNDLVPWGRSDAADETLRRLVRAGQNDGPSAESLRAAPRAIAALLAGGATTMFATTAAGSGVTGAAALGAKKSLSTVLLIKWFGFGLLAGGSVVLVANVPRLTRPAPEVAVHAAAAVPRRSPERPVLPSRAVNTEPLASAASSVAVNRATSRTDLAREIVLLDRARMALAAGAPRRALEALDDLVHLPTRALTPEATVLRVRALLAVGSREHARQVVEDFARRAPGSPQIAVLRGLLGQGNGKPGSPVGDSSDVEPESVIQMTP